MSGRRRPAGPGAAQVARSSQGPGPAPEPLPGLARRSPAQERVFQIFSSRMTMAARWDRSPVSRKMFMAAAAICAAAPGSAAQAAAAAAPERKRRSWRERARRGQGRGRTAGARAGQLGRAGDRQAPPLKGHAQSAGRARAQLQGSLRGTLTPCQLPPARFPASPGEPAISFNF